MNKDPLIFIEHILENINLIEESRTDSKENLKKNKTLQNAILRELEIIGEAVKNLPKSFTEKYKDIQWKQIAGLRDKLIHNYFGVDLNLVWEVIISDVPKLKEKMLQIKTDLSD